MTELLSLLGLALPERTLAFCLASFAIIVVPGPSVLFVVSRALSHGRRAALATVAGNCAGVYVQIIGVAFGLGSLIERTSWLYDVVKIVGAGYLIWLGVQAFRTRDSLGAALESFGAAKTGQRLFRDGFIVGIANPKILVFFAAILPQFVDRAAGGVVGQMLILGIVFEVIAFVSDSAWGMAAGSARAWFVQSPKRLSMIGGAGGLAIVGLGLRLAVSGRNK